MHPSLPGFKLALMATLLAVVVVTLGAYTRLVDAGLGCPDWPTCYGHLWAPQTAEEIHAANSAYPHIPVDHDKTWPEMVHRLRRPAHLGCSPLRWQLLPLKTAASPTCRLSSACLFWRW